MASEELVAGKELGRFSLVRRLALGGMAEIWLARDPEEESRRSSSSGPWRAQSSVGVGEELSLEPLIALKILLSPYAKDPSFRAMFVDEVNIASRLSHENIVRVFGAFEIEGHLVQAMELVDGKDLRRVLSSVARASQRFPIPLALLVTREVARALSYAHMKRGEDGKPLEIVHRDVSPHNVMITRDGSVKLLDFGIARAAERLTRTRTGVIKGKIAYMAPEQAMAVNVTQKTDIFATGIVLWEMLAMQRLFKAESDAQILERVIKGIVPPIRELNPEVPQEVCTLLDQMLALRPQMRPDSMRLVETTLSRLLNRLYPDEESNKAALASWAQRHLDSEQRTNRLGAVGLDPGISPPPLPAKVKSAPDAAQPNAEAVPQPVDQTIAMRADERPGASGEHMIAPNTDEIAIEVSSEVSLVSSSEISLVRSDEVSLTASGEHDSTLPDAKSLPEELTPLERTERVDAPSRDQLGLETMPVRMRTLSRDAPVVVVDPATPSPSPATPSPAMSAPATPSPATPSPATPATPARRSESSTDPVRLPTKSEIVRAVDAQATVPMEFDPEAAKAAVRIFDEAHRPSLAPKVLSAPNTPATPSSSSPGLVRASGTTELGDLAAPFKDPSERDAPALDPHWLDSSDENEAFKPVNIGIAPRPVAPAAPAPEPSASLRSLPAEAPPAPSASRLVTIALIASLVVIALLLVLLFMKD